MPGLGFTLITVPSATYSAAKLNNAIGKYTMDIREFNVPQLRVGTLNVLISLSDTLTKLDLSCMSVVGQVEKLGREIHLQRFNSSADDWSDIDGKDKIDFVKTFDWKEVKYPTSRSLEDLTKLLQMNVGKMEEELRKFQASYSEKKQLKVSAERGTKVNLMAIDLNTVLRIKGVSYDGTPIKPLIVEATNKELTVQNFQETNFLKTVVIVVPLNQVKEFEKTYHTLDDGTSSGNNSNTNNDNETKNNNNNNEDESSISLLDDDGNNSNNSNNSNNNDLGVSPVVPNSLVRITSDKECVLYTIVVLKSQRKVSPIGDIQEWEISDSFRTACRKKRYVLRDKFKLDLEATKKAMHYQAQLDSDYNLYEGKTLEWCKVHFGETMIAWAHVKAIRVFIESVLRYGLPPDFDCVLIEPKEGRGIDIRRELNTLYKDLLADDDGMFGGGTDGGDGGEGGTEDGNIYPYVSLEM